MNLSYHSRYLCVMCCTCVDSDGCKHWHKITQHQALWMTLWCWLFLYISVLINENNIWMQIALRRPIRSCMFSTQTFVVFFFFFFFLLLNKCWYFNPFFSKLNESTQVSFYMSKLINKDVHEGWEWNCLCPWKCFMTFKAIK